MALQSSGPISIEDIRNEFGGAAPDDISEYYRGGGRVPDTPINNNIPTGGQVSLSDYYGAEVANLAWRGIEPICIDDSFSVVISSPSFGVVEANVTGGSPNFTYEWSTDRGDSNTSTTFSRSNQSPSYGEATYSVVVTDTNGKQAFDIFTLFLV